MLRDENLDAAVAAGIMTEAQALSLREFARQRDKERRVVRSHEERFRFMSGFNDFFFAVGIVLFAIGMAFFALPTPAGCLIAALITWALAELLVGRLRLVLPGILLVAIFAAFAMAAAPVDYWYMPFQIPPKEPLSAWFTKARGANFPPLAQFAPIALAYYCLAGVVAAAIFYARFRLPFALLVIAGCLVGAVVAAFNQRWPEHAPYIRSLVLLGCGLLTFIAAMAFDLSDRERLTRRADCAFWLHLLAAPLIVHSLVALVTPNYLRMAGGAAEIIIAIFLCLTIVAIIIDRRALLVSALIYMGVLIAYGIRGAVGDQSTHQSFVFFTTLLVLGSLVLALGVGWRPLRRLFIRILPAAVGRRLPPVPAAA